ncbi:MAG: hypothetical protein OXU36_18700 [Candidatus Poribacteria bacterium]|nr:hypothetical protein [Candidatus Poribacteria bacterium]
MAIPTRWELTLPILKLLAVENLDHPEHSDRLARQFNVTDDEREETSLSGVRKFQNTAVGHAKRELKAAGLIRYGGGTTLEPAKITLRGRRVLDNPPTCIDREFLRKFPEYRQKLEQSARKAKRK